MIENEKEKLDFLNSIGLNETSLSKLIKEGYDADFTFVDLSKTKKISNKLIQSKCGWTPFHGMKVKGWPVGTMINGNKVFWNEKIVGKPIGKPIKFCLIANGNGNIYPRLGTTMEWDTAAGHAILNAAGGSVKTLDRKVLKYGKQGFKNTSFIARS